jgi:hypothetical protein
MRVCKESHAGGKEYLRTLPGLVVCGGRSGDEAASDVLRLSLATMRWEPMPPLVTGRYDHACCAVRGNLAVLGAFTQEGRSSSVEKMHSSSSEENGGAFQAAGSTGSTVQPESRWTRATAPRGKCS